MTPAWRRAIVVSVAGLLITSLVGALFAHWLQATGDWRQGLPWERSFMLSLDREVPKAFDWLMLGLPWIGTNLTLLPIVAGVSFWLWRKRARGELAAHLMVTVLGSLVLNAVLKAVYDRPRPELWPHRGQYQWASYPSGHAIVGVSVMFTIALVLWHERGWWWPLLAAACVLCLNLYSRLYLGVHWPTDLLGGLLLGVLWLAVTQYAFRPLERRAIVGANREPAPADRGTFARRLSSRA